MGLKAVDPGTEPLRIGVAAGFLYLRDGAPWTLRELGRAGPGSTLEPWRVGREPVAKTRTHALDRCSRITRWLPLTTVSDDEPSEITGSVSAITGAVAAAAMTYVAVLAGSE